MRTRLSYLSLRTWLSLILILGSTIFSIQPSHAAPTTVNCGTSGSFSVETNTVQSNSSCSGTATIPAGVTSIAGSAFLNNTSITGVNFPTGLLTIGASAFYGSGVTNITIPASVTNISGAFYRAGNLTSVTFQTPSSLTSIPASTFRVLSANFKSVVIPEGVTTIGSLAFGANSGLSIVTMPSTIVSIDNSGNSAFLGSPLTCIVNASGNTVVANYPFPNNPRIVSSISDCYSPVTVKFDSNGGNAVNNASVTVGSALSAPTAPTRNGYTFNGWSKIQGGPALTFPYTVNETASFTLYALWTSATGVSPSWGNRTIPVATNWGSVAYGGGLFVAVSFANTASANIMTSPDGVNWTARNITNTPLNGAAYGEVDGSGVYVAVGAGGKIFSSSDGITWTSRTSPVANNFNGVTFGNGLFVAVASSGTNNRVVTSPDGITWTFRSTPVNNSWMSVTFGNNLFVAAANTGTGDRIMTSPDGINWTARNSINDDGYYSIAYGNGTFVAAGAGAFRAITSTDGINWTSQTTSGASTWVGITYGDGLFVVVPQGGGAVMSSPDGVTWTNKSYSPDRSYRGVAFGKGIFVAVAYNALTTSVMTTGPALTSITPTSGSSLGGTTVKISGTSLTGTTGAKVNGIAATIQSITDTTVAITTPASDTSVAVSVELSNVNGSVSLASSFTYLEQYRVTYDGNSAPGGSQASDTFTVGSPLTLPATTTFTKTGYTFAGWGSVKDTTTAVTTYSTRAAKTFYAIWTANSYTVTFYANYTGATGTMATQTRNAATALTANAFSVSNRTFRYWNTQANGSGTQYTDGQSYTFVANTNLYAQWGVTVNYSSLGADTGTASRTTDLVDTSTLTLPTVGTMSKAGYTFGGWSNGVTTYTTNYTPSANITLNPVWTPNTYTISFNKNGPATGTVPGNQSWIESTTALTLSGNTGSLARDGYTFGGWATSASAPQTAITIFSTTSTTLTQTLYAIWTPISYSITYNLNGGDSTLPTQSNLNIGQTFTTADKPTRSGYLFAGWSNGATIYSARATYTISTSNVVLTAQWIALYTLHYILNGSGDTPAADTTTVGGTVLQLADTPTLTGYTFAGWLDNNNIVHRAQSNFTIIQDSNLIAQWTAITYSITYNTAGASSSTPTQSSLSINQRFNTADTPIRAGYRFTGWSDGTNTYGERASYTVGTSNISFTAQWSAISYSVTYDLGGGYLATPPTQSNVNIGNTFNLYNGTDPAWLAHTFTGWSDGTRTYAKNAVYTAGSSNIVLAAQYTLNGYTRITYAFGTGGSGTLPTQNALLEGSNFIVASSSTLTNSGYSFAGWDDGRATYQGGDTFYVGPDSSPVTLTALWVSGYTVTYLAGTGSGSVPTDSNTYATSATFTLLSAGSLSQSGYTFGGWNDGATTYGVGDVYTVGSAAITFTALWTQGGSSSNLSGSNVLNRYTPTSNSIVAAQVEIASNKNQANKLFSSIPTPAKTATAQPNSNPTESQIQSVGDGKSINSKVAQITTSKTALISLPSTNVILSDYVVEKLAKSATIVSTEKGITVTPVGGFTGVLVVPTVATIAGEEIIVLNKVVVSPVPPVALASTPVDFKKSAISWSPSSSQVVTYQVTINGKVACQSPENSCAIPTLIGPKSKVTITAVGNEQTTSTPAVVPYAPTAPIPALKVNFATASSALSATQKAEIKSVAKIIKDQGFTKLVVSGFADARGDQASNDKLSQQRADAVAGFMKTLLPKVNVKVTGLGSKNPVGSNSDEAGQAQNRRTEIATW